MAGGAAGGSPFRGDLQESRGARSAWRAGRS